MHVEVEPRPAVMKSLEAELDIPPSTEHLAPSTQHLASSPVSSKLTQSPHRISSYDYFLRLIFVERLVHRTSSLELSHYLGLKGYSAPVQNFHLECALDK